MNTSAIASVAPGAGHPAPAGIDAPWTAPTVTRRQVSYATWVCFFAWVFAVYDFILFGTLLPQLGEHFQWSAEQQARLNTRSEEHTSELQSPCNLVCRLLLEKKTHRQNLQH